MELDADVMRAEEISSDKLAEIYIKIRDSRAELKEQYEGQDSALKEQLDVVADKMLSICHLQNADSIKTKAGTIIRKIDTRYWTSDWESMYKFVEENDAFPLLEKRLHQTNMRQFLEENPDLLPAGLMTDSKYSIVVRRSK
jgi:hypothetical protein